MTLFALLHGGMHLPSSWDAVAADLRVRGFRVVTPDLPVDDAAAGAQDWARIAIRATDEVIGGAIALRRGSPSRQHRSLGARLSPWQPE